MKQYLEIAEVIFIVLGLGNSLILILGLFRKSKDPVKKGVKDVLRLIGKKKHLEARERLDSMLFHPGLTEEGKLIIRSVRSRVLFDLKEYVAAYSDISYVMSKDSDKLEVENYILKLLCEVQLKKKEKAKETITTALKLFPNHPLLMNLLKTRPGR